MALNFPNSPIAGDKVTLGGRKYQYSGAVWTADDTAALTRNRIINPAMTISQEWGNITSGSVANGDFYAADQWQTVWSITGAATILGKLVATDPSYPFYPGKFIQYVASAASAAGSGDYAQIRQLIEGQRIADFLWGTANARNIIIRFWMQVSTPGTYSMAVYSFDGSRSYCVPLVVTAGSTWQQFTISVPGCTDGVWPTDNTLAMMLIFPARLGSGLQGTPNTWLTSGAFGVTGTKNFNENVAGGYIISQVEMYLDPFKTGVAPRFEFPNEADELRKCQRYWYRGYGARGVNTNTDRPSRMTIKNPVYMRVPPTIALKGTVGMYSTQITSNAIGVVGNTSSVETVEVGVSTGAVFTVGRVACQYFTGVDNYFAVSARM
jgi:hypothetical protein